MLDLIAHFLKTTLKSWQRGNLYIRAIILFAGACTLVGGVVFLASQARLLYPPIGQTISFGLFGVAALIYFIIAAREQLQEEAKTQEKLERVEERAREHPDRPQLAWDLARAKLENYLDRNLGQLRSIFWLTSFVMLIGFGLVLYGLIKAYDHPEALPISVVGSVSGVIISFIGGSFLLIYRSILTQTRRYVSVLERINAVGMAVQVLGSISEDNKDLRNQSTAILARQLIGLYALPHQAYVEESDEEATSTRRKGRSKNKETKFQE
jgi:TctA family transporter